ncbi:hypothetical protein FB45DRAFT_1138718 [Roridomyces roridus]|uniref:Uncharacterized protein n=1 Tax=Roridomyces roridus TaxID=1738132 RepID=A0AAD7C1T2_9AGAR|nr:hypothetical protein FB45DRAFT_1138718 [Roridomyces roridus]
MLTASRTLSVQAASVSIHGAHGQHIENVHLQTYTSPEHWEVLYKERYSRILRSAEEFLDKTGWPGEDVLVFISCGMDASEHEMPSVSRNRRVPTAGMALMSGAMAHLVGLSESGVKYDELEEWWNKENLDLLEKATKKRRGGRTSVVPADHPWLERALGIFASLDPGAVAYATSSSTPAPIAPSSRT